MELPNAYENWNVYKFGSHDCCSHRSLGLLHERGSDAPEDTEDEKRLHDLGIRQAGIIDQEGIQERAELRAYQRET